ncbi:DEHA2F00396p [Debaryomyces hansenii CBS767]|uniref:DEHA2F00396p n=1 Tax=Debaryomyces hansenii (strain ATCC 36239 / CBS 767 / BCRC 21394 / JCM 1990 / NBRC 0083 / IGC 2968) TaxID=284592 RepID=Q6BN42_DEBHA|nr:DEHA2F00396p [Debaryomyces hansenii CBS767]CAG88680.1 DEHA2F00396p [Debaryomyces hansenii CBS767]|eukprot:XP_460378.1 DEHA2F00396p [Debaryomyces hansenii CBS767]
MESTKDIIIVGAGIFGLSTAIALAERYANRTIHVVDRFEPPVPDGSSVDTTRCIRFDYKDETYCRLAHESMNLIKADPMISKLFHQQGMTFVYDGNHDTWEDIFLSSKSSAEKVNEREEGKMDYYDSAEDVFRSIHNRSPNSVETTELGGPKKWNKGYTNRVNGFIDARASIKVYYERARNFPNVNFRFQEVEKIDYFKNTKKVKGVLLKNGDKISADLVIVAAGAWSCKLVNLDNISKSSAIEVVWFKVTPSMEKEWKQMSITTNLSTGINIFPPYNGEIKVLRRSAGYKNTVAIESPSPFSRVKQEISVPRTIIDSPKDWIPEEAEIEIRGNLKEIMPSLCELPFDRTKLCWLTQTTTSNFIIDYYPEAENVLVATGGSAHAWKFVPIIGDKVVDFIEGRLETELIRKWSWKEKLTSTVENENAPRMKGDPKEMKECIRNVYDL